MSWKKAIMKELARRPGLTYDEIIALAVRSRMRAEGIDAFTIGGLEGRWEGTARGVLSRMIGLGQLSQHTSMVIDHHAQIQPLKRWYLPMEYTRADYEQILAFEWPRRDERAQHIGARYGIKVTRQNDMCTMRTDDFVALVETLERRAR